jgi:hypothetical protein
LGDITVEVIQDIGATEGQWKHQRHLNNGMDEASYPGCHHQSHAELSVHDGNIVEGPGNGNKVITGHD